MAHFSFTNLLLVVGLGYFLFTAWSLYEVFFPSDCSGEEMNCLKPSWKPQDRFFNKTGDESASSSSSSEPSPPGQPDDQSPVSFWLSTLRVFLLRTPVVFNLNTVAAELVPHIRPTSDKRSQRPVYLPVVYVNPLMQPSADWTETPVVSHRDEQEYPTMKFTVSVEPQSIGKFRLRCMLGMMAEQLRSY
ncbi:hypothetical protein X801_08301, partial [Opisthorchis viverrini]